jgi:hypothetical protein
MSEYEDLLVEAYRGECLGAALFGAMATRESDDGRRERLRALAQVEAQTATRLRALVESAAIADCDEGAARADGVRLAEGLGAQPWLTFLGDLRSALPPFLEKFERLAAIGDPGDPILVDLVAHERAVDTFAALERDGRSAEALAVLRAHLDTPEPARPGR